MQPNAQKFLTEDCSTWQWPEAYSQDNARVTLQQVSDYPWVARPKPRFKLLLTSAKGPGWQFRLTMPETVCQEEWDKLLPKSSCSNLVETYLRRIAVVIAAKWASANCWIKYLKTSVKFHYYFFFLANLLKLWKHIHFINFKLNLQLCAKREGICIQYVNINLPNTSFCLCILIILCKFNQIVVNGAQNTQNDAC